MTEKKIKKKNQKVEIKRGLKKKGGKKKIQKVEKKVG